MCRWPSQPLLRNRVLAISIQVYDVQRPWGQGIYIEVPSVVSKGSIVLLVDGINTIDNAYALCFVPKVTHLRTKASTGDHSMLSFLGSETSTSILVYVHGFIYFPCFLFVHFFFISFFFSSERQNTIFLLKVWYYVSV